MADTVPHSKSHNPLKKKKTFSFGVRFNTILRLGVRHITLSCLFLIFPTKCLYASLGRRFIYAPCQDTSYEARHLLLNSV